MSLFSKKKDKNIKIENRLLLPEEVYQSAVQELQDILAPSAVKVEQKQLRIGDRYMKTLFIVQYPKFLNMSWFSPIINLDKEFDIAMHIDPIDTSYIVKKFEKKVAEIQSQITEREKSGKVRDPVLENAYINLENLRDQLLQATEKMYSIGVYISIYADSEKELRKIEGSIKSILESSLIYVRPASFQQVDGLKTIVPTGKDFLDVKIKLNSEPLSSFFPFVSFDLTSNKGILYGINRHNSSLILFDRYSLPNYNSVTFATSGAGKSFMSKLEILRSLMFDTDVIVIDPEREYEFLSEVAGGRYFNISLTSEHHINPFDLPAPAEDESRSDVLRSQIVNLMGFFRILFDGLTPGEEALLDRAIAETYALKDITPDSKFENIEPPLLSDLELVLAGMSGTEKMISKLSKFTIGTWSGFLNKPSNVSIDNHFIVFSIRDMENELRTIAMYLVTSYIWSTIRRKLKKRLFVVDEAWTMMKTEDSAAFLFSMAKRGRKYFLGMSTITQDVNDFIGSKYGVPIITNSSMQFLMKQSPTGIDQIKKVFNLTDEEKYLLMKSGVGEGIFFIGTKHVAIKVIASYTEEQIITSDPAAVLAMKAQKRKAQEEQDAFENS